jgi:uncharacterized protein YaaR (DUF327 family)
MDTTDQTIKFFERRVKALQNDIDDFTTMLNESKSESDVKMYTEALGVAEAKLITTNASMYRYLNGKLYYDYQNKKYKQSNIGVSVLTK